MVVVVVAAVGSDALGSSERTANTAGHQRDPLTSGITWVTSLRFPTVRSRRAEARLHRPEDRASSKRSNGRARGHELCSSTRDISARSICHPTHGASAYTTSEGPSAAGSVMSLPQDPFPPCPQDAQLLPRHSLAHPLTLGISPRPMLPRRRLIVIAPGRTEPAELPRAARDRRRSGGTQHSGPGRGARLSEPRADRKARVEKDGRSSASRVLEVGAKRPSTYTSSAALRNGRVTGRSAPRCSPCWPGEAGRDRRRVLGFALGGHAKSTRRRKLAPIHPRIFGATMRPYQVFRVAATASLSTLNPKVERFEILTAHLRKVLAAAGPVVSASLAGLAAAAA